MAKSLTAEILEILKDISEEDKERYNGNEWIEAAEAIAALEKPVTFSIPWCIWDVVLDEFGQPLMMPPFDDVGSPTDPVLLDKPKREIRMDVLAILTWIPLKRDDPDLTLDEVKSMLNEGNVRALHRKAFYFWGVDLRSEESMIEEAMEKDIESETPEEAEDNGNFTEEQ